MASALKIDSNVTGLRYAEETSIKVLPGTPAWKKLEPNSYNDFGGQLGTVARNPITDDRQRKKGVTIDLDAAGGFNMDFTQKNTQDLLQGFMFASSRLKAEAGGITGAVAATDEFTAASGLDAFAAGDIVHASGFTNTANNGRHLVSSAGAASLVVTSALVDETPPAVAKLVRVGVRGAAGDIDVDVAGSLPALTSTTLDFTTLGLVVGEFMYVGGDAVGNSFANTQNNGFKRISSIAANRLEFDKSDSAMVSESSTTETVELFFGRVLKNETGSNIVRRSYNLERTLGAPDTAFPAQIQSEYLVGTVANEMGLNFNTADKLTMDLSFVATDHETRSGATGVKSGTRETLVDSDVYNTTSDVKRINMAVIVDGVESPAQLFTYVEEMTLTVNNNVTPNKAISVLGAFDMTAGTFLVNGQLTVFFSDIAAVAAVRNNSNVTLDMVLVKANSGVAIDLPLISLGEGRVTVEQDQPVKLPISHDAASGAQINANMNHTLLFTFFDYLPNAAGV